MKIEFLVALHDRTWYTKIVDVPDADLPQSQGEVSPREPYLTEAVGAWAMEHISLFDGDIALVVVYNSNPEDDVCGDVSVEELILALQQVKDKRQTVGALVMGAEIGDTFITGVKSEIPDENDPPDTIGVCWLTLPGNSSLHE